jgi:hypothetical protein
VSGYEQVEPNRIKHMEMIQVVIGRLGNDSFLIKGWAVTIAGALMGFAINSSNGLLGIASMAVTLVFWMLDAFYLRAERLFRELFDRVRQNDPDVEPFFMAATGTEFVRMIGDAYCSRWTVFWSKTLRIFYGALESAAVATIVIVLVLSANPGR